ncbi:MAG: hypothetical protein LBE75_02315 [Burkholderiales bacterium]|jgi:hypothetical protein|nr:hypothetical protein [Burkholderiales bacterium]
MRDRVGNGRLRMVKNKGRSIKRIAENERKGRHAKREHRAAKERRAIPALRKTPRDTTEKFSNAVMRLRSAKKNGVRSKKRRVMKERLAIPIVRKVVAEMTSPFHVPIPGATRKIRSSRGEAMMVSVV